MKTISDYTMPKPRTKKEWESYYRIVEKSKELEKQGIIVEYA